MGSKPAANGASSGVDTLIGRHTEITGDVRFAGGLHLDGKIRGAVITTGDQSATLSISESGAVEGDVRVPNVVLNGSVTGDVYATALLSLAAKAKVTGNVHYKTLRMEPGAQINGQLIYDDGSAPPPALTHQRWAAGGTDGGMAADSEDGGRIGSG